MLWCLLLAIQLTLKLWFCLVTPDRMRNVSCSVWSSLSCCFTSTGTCFQYSVLALAGSKPLDSLASSSSTRGMLLTQAGPEHKQEQGYSRKGQHTATECRGLLCAVWLAGTS